MVCRFVVVLPAVLLFRWSVPRRFVANFKHKSDGKPDAFGERAKLKQRSTPAPVLIAVVQALQTDRGRYAEVWQRGVVADGIS